jgi:GMP synthase-like glutamine amidotransferase
MVIHVLQHVAHEGPGLVAEWAGARGHELYIHPVFESIDLLPQLADIEALVILGGPMSVHDEVTLPWLQAEKAFIRATIAAGRPVLGVCLGAQLLAEALGGEVYDGVEPEIGWFPVQLSGAARQSPLLAHAPAAATVMHWHGETFSVPPGATLLGGSAACANQGFIWQYRVVGLQFHPEVNDELLAQMLQHEGHELTGGGQYIETVEAITAGLAKHGAGARELLFGILDRLFA